MTAESGMGTRQELLRTSLQEGGFGQEKRREAWLQLLGLQHLESQLRASTSKLSAPPNTNVDNADTSSSSLLDGHVPLDGDGWQIPRLSHLDIGPEDDEREWEAEQWDIATSKRQRRRKIASSANGAVQRRVSVSETSASVSATEVTDPLEQSLSGTVQEEDSEDGQQAQREERKRRRREKKKEKRKLARTGDEAPHDERVGIEASGILLPPSQVVEDERDESLKDDWVQADGHHADKNGEASSPHRDEAQVALDIDRSFNWLEGDVRSSRRDQLSRVIIGVLRRHPSLNYYQGYHDIISVLLLELIPHADGMVDADAALQAVIELASRFSLHFLRDNMTVNMEPTMGHLKVLRNLLRRADYGTSVEVESASALPYFALPWLISLFAHELKADLTACVFDYILARGPASALYLSAALILHDRQGTSIKDAAEKHHSLSQLPLELSSATLPLIAAKSDALWAQYSIESAGMIMGPRSMFFTWPQLPIMASKAEIPTPWSHADALAEAILTGATENIVVDALPTPPASDDGWTEKEKGKRSGKRRQGKEGQRTASVLAFVGAVGTVGVAALLMYGAGRGGIGLG